MLAAQGGELRGIEMVGGFVAPNTPEGDAWRAAELAARLETRLAPLDALDAMHDEGHETDCTQLRYNLLRRNANSIPNYWKRITPPRIARPVMHEIADKRDAITKSVYNHIFECAPPPAADRK